MSKQSNLFQVLVTAIAIGIFLIVFPLIAQPYWLVLAFIFFTTLALTESWNIAGGYCNLISLGQGSFVGIGGYTTFILFFMGIPFEVGIICGACISSFLAVLLSKPLFKLRGIYFTIGTLALGEIIKLLVIKLPYFGGGWGLHITSIPSYYGTTYLYYLSLICSAITLFIVWKIATSRMGWALKCIRGDEDLSELVGIATYKYKSYAFAVHAFFSGLIGGVLALQTLHIEPYTSFGLSWSITSIVAVFVGGQGTFFGPLIGTTFIVILSHFLAVYYTLHLVILGFILIAIIIFYPKGIMGFLKRKIGEKFPWNV